MTATKKAESCLKNCITSKFKNNSFFGLCDYTGQHQIFYMFKAVCNGYCSAHYESGVKNSYHVEFLRKMKFYDLIKVKN